MRWLLFSLLVSIAACGTADSSSDDSRVGDGGGSDASIDDASSDDASLDAATSDVEASGDATSSDAGMDGAADADADAATCPTTLLVGGMDIAAQGWSTAMQAPATLTLGADYVRIATSTNAGAVAGGQLLIVHPGAFDAAKPFSIEVVMLVESVAPHNALDSAAAILGSFTPPFGTTAERAEMIYLDSAAIGWADDTQSKPFTVQDAAYHTYVLSVDAAHAATVSVDGVTKLTRSNFTTNGTLAIGDQTNEPNVDGAVRIRSVRKLCP